MIIWFIGFILAVGAFLISVVLDTFFNITEFIGYMFAWLVLLGLGLMFLGAIIAIVEGLISLLFLIF